MAQRIEGHVDLRVLFAFPTMIAGPVATLGRGAQSAAAMIAALGSALRPVARRSTAPMPLAPR